MGKNERRKFIRFPAYHLIKYKILAGSEITSLPILSFIRDISGGGSCLQTKEKIPLFSIVQLYINFPPLPEAIICTAKVIWLKKLKQSNKYESGLEFIEINAFQRQEIIRRVGAFTKKQTLQKRRT